MSKQTDSSFLIVSSVPALYQHILRGVAGYQELGIRVLREIEVANACRQTERVKDLASILVRIPIREYQLAAQYHLVLCKCREMEYQSEALEQVAEHCLTYRAKALISRAALDVYQGNAESALYFYTEALRLKPTVSDFIKASTGIVALKSLEGFHRSALKDIERFVPLLRHAEPLTYFQALNSYAVELAENDRLIEAQNVLTLAETHPLASFYPELQETLSEIRSKRKRRSTVTISWSQVEQEDEAKLEVQENALRKARVRAVIGFMNANLHRSIALAELARTARLSPAYFCYLFKIETGVAPGEYLIRLKMGKAAHLLAATFLSVKEIMAEIGYNNRSNFVRRFKRQFQMTPSEYRKLALT